jgi:hypothetical protein
MNMMDNTYELNSTLEMLPNDENTPHADIYPFEQISDDKHNLLPNDLFDRVSIQLNDKIIYAVQDPTSGNMEMVGKQTNKLLPTLDEVMKTSSSVRTFKDLYLFFCKVLFVNNYTKNDKDSSQEILIFEDDHMSWWSWMKPQFDSIHEKDFVEINIQEQVQNVINCGAIIINSWKGQTEIVIGCGHKFHKDHKTQYTVDIDSVMGSDCILSFGQTSLSRAIPNAKGQISQIIIEGLLIHQTQCFHNDLLELLTEGGLVCSDEIPILIKTNGKILIIGKNPIPYKPWSVEITTYGPKLVDFGADPFNWNCQIIKVKEENANGVWDHIPKNPKTPFDRDFLINEVSKNSRPLIDSNPDSDNGW